MNLTTPPPVEELDPVRADQLRQELVKGARKSQRQRPVWIPVLAAACGIAVITTTVVVLAQSGGSGSIEPPAASTSPTPGAVQQVPASKSASVSLDLGPADPGEARTNAGRCLGQAQAAQPDDAPAQSELDSATLHDARWVKHVPGHDYPNRPDYDRVLMQTFTTAKGVWMMCLGTDFQRLEKNRKNGSARTDQAVSGKWNRMDVPDGRSTLYYADYTFDAMPNVAKVELRIRWSGGASPWYGIAVKRGAGYLEASQPGASKASGEVEIDVRAFDQAGKEIFTEVEPG